MCVNKLRSHTLPHNRFSNLGTRQRGWEPTGNLTLRTSGIWIQKFHRSGETRTLRQHQQNPVCTRTQKKGAVTPQETEPDLLMTVQESPAKAWVNSDLPWGQGRWLQQYWEVPHAGISPLGGGCLCLIVWPQVKLQGGNTAPPISRKSKLKIYWAWPCPPEQDPVSPSISLSHQEAFIKPLILLHQRTDRMKTTITKN